MASANCTIVGRRTGSGTYDTANSAYVGYGSSTEFYPYALKFTLPSFSGVSSAVAFSLSMYGGYRNGSKSSTVNLRWALCSSDANINSYNTAGAVSDPNQIVSGTVTFDGLNSSTSAIKTLNIPTAALKSGGTYYLILWGNNSGGYSGDTATMNAASKHSAMLEYGSGVVWVGDSATVPDRYSGVDWKTIIPEKYNGSSWEVTV